METFTFVDASNKRVWSRQKEKENMLTECIFLSDNSRNLNIEARATFYVTNEGHVCSFAIYNSSTNPYTHLDEQSLTVKLGQTYSLGNLDYVNVL